MANETVICECPNGLQQDIATTTENSMHMCKLPDGRTKMFRNCQHSKELLQYITVKVK